MRTGIGLNFSRAGNLAGIKREIPRMVVVWENLHTFRGNGGKVIKYEVLMDFWPIM